MDFEFTLNLPFSAWDYLPLPSLAAKSEHYEFIVKLQLPTFSTILANYLGVAQLTKPEVTPTVNASTIPDATTTDLLLPQLIQKPLVVLPDPKLVSDCRALIDSGHFELCEEGVGGTYFIRNTEGSILGVFKPMDEEPGAPNNPKNIIQNPILAPGGGGLREVAAYLLDRNNFAGVPETHLLSGVRHPLFHSEGEKTGSLQRFLKNDGLSSDMGSSIFSVEDIHRIGVLDIRIFNMDRNGENLLVRRENGQARLIPIDHTYSLPPITSLDSAYFEWHYWAQAHKPFSQETLDYIHNINIEEDTLTLRSLGIPEECILTMIVSTILLKEAVASGCTLFEIASFMARPGLPDPSAPSKLEELVSLSFSEDAEIFLDNFRQNLKASLASS